MSGFRAPGEIQGESLAQLNPGRAGGIGGRSPGLGREGGPCAVRARPGRSSEAAGGLLPSPLDLLLEPLAQAPRCDAGSVGDVLEPTAVRVWTVVHEDGCSPGSGCQWWRRFPDHTEATPPAHLGACTELATRMVEGKRLGCYPDFFFVL